MSEWPTTPIGEVAEIFDGPHATPKTVDVGPIFLGIGALRNGRIDLGEARHVTPEDFRTWTRRVKPRAGDVVFSYETRLGEVAIIPPGFECCLGRRMGLVRPHPKQLDARFFLYFYLSPYFQQIIRSRTITGATVDRIALKEFPFFPILLPPLSEQQRIASILSALDDKIELNRQMNETLEAMARALFKDWFVDFGPTRAKMEGRTPYLAPEIWSLFPDRLDDEGKPEGWEIERLSNIVSKNPGSSIKTGPFGTQLHQADYVPDGVPVVMPTNLITGSISEDGISRITAENAGRLQEHKLRVGDIIYGRRGDIGRKALVSANQEGWICGTGCLKLRITASDCPPSYLFYFLDLSEIREWISARAIGATMPNLNTSIMGEVEVLVPGTKMCTAFCEAVEPLQMRATAARLECGQLTALRDLLLPKLMSGEIRIKDAEKILEDAL